MKGFIEIFIFIGFFLGCIGIWFQLFYTHKLLKIVSRNPRIALAAIYNRGRKAFLVFGISAFIFSLIEIIAILLPVFLFSRDEKMFYLVYTFINSIGIIILIAFPVATRMLKKIVEETLRF